MTDTAARAAEPTVDAFDDRPFERGEKLKWTAPKDRHDGKECEVVTPARSGYCNVLFDDGSRRYVDTSELNRIPAARAAEPEILSAETVQHWRHLCLGTSDLAALCDSHERLRAEVAAAREEIAIDDKLLAERDRILDALPCPDHGRCVPYVLEQIARVKADTPEKP